MSVCNDSFSYGCFGCIDFVNNARTYAYHRHACLNGLYPDECIPEMEECYCEFDEPTATYTSPAVDSVCWYDADLPESEEFLGVIVLNVAGFYDSTFNRTVSEVVGIGSNVSKARIPGKSLGFEIAFLATSARGMLYGINWLKGVLQNSYTCSTTDCDSCAGKTLALRSACSYDPGCNPEIEDCDTGVSYFYNVALIDGIKLVAEAIPDSCCCNVMRRATFTMQTTLPYSYSSGKLLYDKYGETTDYSKCFDFDFCDTEICNFCDFIAGGDCERDPACGFCGSSSLIVEAPIAEQCWCYPWCTQIHAYCNTAAPYGIQDAAYRIQIYSGLDTASDSFSRYGLRNTRIEFYRNPYAFDCIDDDISYDQWANVDPCLRIWIPYIPPNATFEIDSRTNKITVNCKGSCYDYSSRVDAEFSSIFPILSSCGDMMIAVKYDCTGVRDGVAVPGMYKKTNTKIYQYKRWN